MILLWGEVSVFIYYTRSVENTTGVIVDITAREGQVRCVPSVCVVEDRGNESENDHPSGKHICLSPEWYDERRPVVCDLGPVKSGRQIREPSRHAKEVIDNDVVYQLLECGFTEVIILMGNDSLGAAQQMKANVLRPVNRNPGSQY
jgi:hypothetical protein